MQSKDIQNIPKTYSKHIQNIFKIYSNSIQNINKINSFAKEKRLIYTKPKENQWFLEKINKTKGKPMVLPQKIKKLKERPMVSRKNIRT